MFDFLQLCFWSAQLWILTHLGVFASAVAVGQGRLLQMYVANQVPGTPRAIPLKIPFYFDCPCPFFKNFCHSPGCCKEVSKGKKEEVPWYFSGWKGLLFVREASTSQVSHCTGCPWCTLHYICPPVIAPSQLKPSAPHQCLCTLMHDFQPWRGQVPSCFGFPFEIIPVLLIGWT